MQYNQTQYQQPQYQQQYRYAPAPGVLVGVGGRFLALLIDSIIIGAIACHFHLDFPALPTPWRPGCAYSRDKIPALTDPLAYRVGPKNGL